MRSKKLISLLCAATLTVSSFAGLTISASAADENVLWSDTFDGYAVPETTYGEWCTDVLVQGASNKDGTYKEIGGITLKVGGRDDGDDSTYWSLHSKDNDKYLTTATGRFATADRGAKLIFDDEFKADDSNDIVMDFDWMATECRDANCTYDRAFAITGKDATGTAVSTLVDKTAAGVDFDTWTDVKAVVDTTGTKVYAGANTTPIATSTATSITGLDFSVYISGAAAAAGKEYRIDGKPEGYPMHSFDDVVVFKADAGAGLTATVPAAETKGNAEIEYTYAPEGEAPEGLGLIAEDTFDSIAAQRLIYIGKDGESTYTDLNSVNLRVGPASDAQGTTNWSIAANSGAAPTVTDRVLIANNGPRSTSNRGPKMEFKKGTIDERETVVAYFAAKLRAGDNGPAEVIFSGDLTASDSKGDIASPLAMITTDADAASGVYACANPLSQNGDNVLQVNADEWVLVKIEGYRSEGKTAGAKISVTTNAGTDTAETKYIFGSADAYGEVKDSTKSGVNTLPFVSFRSGNDTDYGVSNSVNEIDNIAVYSSNADVQKADSHAVTIAYDSTAKKVTVSTDEVAMFNATLIQARDHKVIKMQEISGISAKAPQSVENITALEGDVFYVWSSLAGLVPYGTKTITAEEGVTSYTVTVAEVANGTVTAGVAKAAEGETVTLDVNPAEGYELETLKANDTDVTATNGVYSFTMPAANVTVTATFKAKTYTVTGTVDAGVEKVVLHPANDTEHTNDIEAKIAETTATFEKVPAGTYAVTATAKSGYENPVIKKGEETVTEITVTDADVADAFAITTTKTPDPVITGTVTITGDVTVGSELTATVEGLNEGKTAKYAWATADTANGTYTAVEGQSTNKLKLTDAMLNKFVKVTVTADGTTGEKTYVTTTAVAAKTYTVTGTVDAGVDTVKLHVKDAADHTADITGTIAGTTVTFANVVAGTYTVEATAKTGYKDLTIKKGTEDVTSVTVTDANVTEAFAVTTTQKAKSAVTTSLLPADTTNGTLTVTGASDLTQVEEGTELTIATTAKLGYNIAVEVKDSDNAAVTVENGKFTMPAKAVTVTATVSQKENTILSNDSTYISRNGKNETNENEVQTQVTTNYNNADTVLIGLNGNYNAMGLYKFAAPTIPNDKEIASAKLTFVVKEMNNKNGDSSLDVNYPNVSTGIDFSTITWYTMFTPTTLTDPKATPWQNLAEGAPFQNVTKLATVNIAKAETNVTHSDIDVTSYVKAQTKKAEDIVLVLNQCSRGANLEKVALIEYTLQDKHYDVTKTDPAAADGTITLPETTSVLPGTEVVFTVTPAAGKKVTAVKVNGETTGVTAGADANTYKYTISAETPADINITAEFARADIATIEIAGDSPVARTTENVYTLTAKAADGTALTLTDDEKSSIAWSLDADAQGVVAASGTTAIAKDGEDATKATLTVDADQAAGNVVVKVVIGDKSGTKTVEITDQTVYTITAATGLVGGAISVNKDKAIADTKITVTVTPDKGYKLTENSLKYNFDSADTPITATENVYSFNVPAATAETINVTAAFEKIDLAITAATAEGGSISFTVNGEAATTAQVGDTVTIVSAPAEGKELASVSVAPTDTSSETTVTVTGNTFTMPAEAVTVTPVFDTAIPKYIEFAEGKIKAVSVQSNTNANATYAQLKRSGATAYSGDGGKEGIYTGFDNPLVYKDGVLFTAYSKISGGKLTKQNDNATVTVFTVDGSALDTVNNKVILGFDVQCVINGKNANLSIAKLNSDNSVGIGDMTYTAMNAMSATEISNALGNGNNTKSTKSLDITNVLNADGVTYFAIYTQAGREQALSNFTLTTTPVYTATVNVTDGSDPLAGATVTLKNGEATVATQTSAETTGVATFAKLDAGTYTVVVEKDGYTPVTNGSITVGAEPATNTTTIALEAITASPASLTIVYTTDGTDGGQVATAEAFSLATGNKYQGDEIAVADLASYKKTIKSTDKDTDGMYNYYAYASGLTEKVTLTNAGENKAYVTVTSLGKYNYYEDFNAMTAFTEWNTDSAATTRDGGIGTDGDNKFLTDKATDKQVGHIIHGLGDDAVTLTDKKVTVEYDIKNTLGTTGVLGAQVDIGDSNPNVILAVGQQVNTASKAMYYFTGGSFATGSTGGAPWGNDGNVASAAAVSAGNFTAVDTWYHVKIVIENGKATLTVNTKNAEDAQSVADIDVTGVTSIDYIKIVSGKVLGGGNGGGAQTSTCAIDNITIKTEA